MPLENRIEYSVGEHRARAVDVTGGSAKDDWLTQPAPFSLSALFATLSDLINLGERRIDPLQCAPGMYQLTKPNSHTIIAQKYMGEVVVATVIYEQADDGSIAVTTSGNDAVLFQRLDSREWLRHSSASPKG